MYCVMSIIFYLLQQLNKKGLLVADTDQSDHAIRMTPNSPHY